MAILEKRKSVNKLPRFERYQDTRGGDRAAALRGETPITSAVRQLAGSSGYGPMGESQGFNPMGGRGAEGVLGTGAAGFGGRPAAGGARAPSNVTSALAGTPAKTATGASVRPTGATAATTPKTLTSTGTGAAVNQKAPALTNATNATKATTGKSLTSTGSGTGAAITNKAGNQSTASKLGTALTSALTGAAVGTGGKLLYDKLTGANKTGNAAGTSGTAGTSKAGTAGTSLTGGTGKNLTTMNGGTGLTGTTNVGGTGIKGTNTAGTGAVTSRVTTPNVKGTGTTVNVGATGPKTPVTSGPKTPVGGGPKTPTGAGPKTPTGGGTRSIAGGAGAAAGAATTSNNDDAYDADGNLKEGYELDEEGNPVLVGENTSTVYNPDGTTAAVTDTVDNGDGTQTVTYADGSTETTDINGDVVASTDATETGDGTDGYFTDAEGNIYDADGNLFQYADGTAYEEGNNTDVAYTDEYGNTYDANGSLIAEADHSDYVYTADDGSTYDWDGNLIAEADHSGFTQQDDYGNTYDYDGNLIAYAEGYNPDDYNSDDYNTDDTVVASNEDDEVDFGAKGGLFGMAGGGSVDEPVDEKQNDDGTITQMFDDGSSITYNEDGEVMKVSEAKGYADGDLVDETGMISDISTNDETGDLYRPLQTNEYGDSYIPVLGNRGYASSSAPVSLTKMLGSANNSMNGADVNFSDNGDGTASYWDGQEYVTVDSDTGTELFRTDSNGDEILKVNPNGVIFDDNPNAGGNSNGTTSEWNDNGDGTYSRYDGQEYVTVDGETGTELSRADNDGNLITVDQQGNKTITDPFGNVVSVYDAQGNKIPLGGLTEAKPITGAGGSGGVNTTKPLTAGQKKTQAANDAAGDVATNDFLKNITSSLGGYGGSALAGAVLGGLLGNSDLFSSGNEPSQSIDMSKVGVLKPRTTDFGVGPANYVTYDQYGTPEAMPELYGNELYQNLNAPGFNEVNPGDYARMDAQDAGNYDQPPADVVGDGYDEYGEPMKDGGQPEGGLGGMQTYYTFGTPVDPLQNLYNPQPAPQQAPQGMPPQAAQNQQQMASSQPVQALPPGMPQGAPQGQNMGMAKPPMPQQNPMQAGPQGLKSGGLPAWSNVPMTAGRLNFRDGAPVHGAGDGQSDDIPAMLADGEYVIDAETVAQIGNGSTKAGAAALDKFRENIRAHKRSAPIHKIPPKTKALTSYLRGAK